MRKPITIKALCVQKLLPVLIGSVCFLNAWSHGDEPAAFLFEANQYQHPAQVKYAADLPGGRLFIEKGKFTYAFYSLQDLDYIHNELDHNQRLSPQEISTQLVHCHAFSVEFVGANAQPSFVPNDQQPWYRNYFTGNDPSKWSSEVKVYGALQIAGLYQGINLNYYSTDGQIKYDLVVSPGTSPDLINMQFTGQESISVINGELLIRTSVNTLKELAPVAYQMINGVKTDVPCAFALNGNTVSFSFPSGYDPAYELVIDPVLVASTYSGTTSTVYGHSATYDNQGHLYAGGRSFGAGYPVTVGAYDVTFGGSVDISISKYSSTGTNLIYATYVGGTSDDLVHSMVVNAAGDLFIMGSTASNDFPATNGAQQTVFGGGFSDIIIAHLNPTGSTMVAATYLGGSSDDGQNICGPNYGDNYRGEINLDGAGNILIANFTQSANFPVTNGAYDNSHNGGQDGVICKLPPALNNLLFSTFIGGTLDDAAYGISETPSGNYLICGATASNNFPTTPGAYQTVFQGGTYDGWVARIAANGASLVNSSYYGTPDYDQVFFSDSDHLDNNYVFGQSYGNLAISNGVYSQANGSLFLAMLNTANAAVTWSTRVGPDYINNFESNTPTAFLVDQCRKIYMSGWGGTGTLPVSQNALQSQTDGDDFYLLVLDEDAQSMLYATYMGDAAAWEHVDGGTSRFDKLGIVYQAVCEGGGTFPTTPGAHASTSNVGWDIVVFKIDFQQQGVTSNAGALPSASGCAPFLVNFDNTSTNAISYFWDFGDGSPTSTQFEPTHTYNIPGTYQVMLIATDPNTCNISDTTYLTINVGAGPNVVANFTAVADNNCGTYTLTLTNTSVGAQVYTWDFGDGTQTSTQFEPTHNYLGLGPYTVTLIVNDTVCNGADTITQQIQFNPNAGSAVADFTFNQTPGCGNSVVTFTNNSSGGDIYLWTFGDNTTSSQLNPVHTYNAQGNYQISLTVTDTACNTQDVHTVNIVVPPSFDIDLGDDGEICPGQPVTLNAGNIADSYSWSNGSTDQYITVNDAGLYIVNVTYNNCIAQDSIYLIALSIPANSDTLLICPGKTIHLHAGPGTNYLWSNGSHHESIDVVDEGSYWYEKDIGYCHYSDTVLLQYRYRSPDVFIPNTFTPNADGLNDEFLVVGAEKEDFELSIFDRWGEKLFYSQNPSTAWTGRYGMNAGLVPQGTYVYKITYRNYCKSSVQETIHGHINVLR